MVYLIKNAFVYSPEPLGVTDVLTGGGKILAIGNRIDISGIQNIEVIEAKGMYLTPGFIDAHVHIAGAGGEGGPATRTPELKLSDMIESGTTTVIGCLGTDGITRSAESVLMKVKSLREQGVSAWMYTGAYQVPTPSITGDYARDIALIEEVIGVGEIAISDHRSSNPSVSELTRIAAHARVAGMLSGCCGIVNLHMGDAKNPFQPVYDVVNNSQLGFYQFLPTHINRNDYIFEDAKTYGLRGYVDITTSSYPYYPQYEIKPATALKLLLEAGVPETHITFTSDACGSLPDFDPVTGDLLRLEMGLPLANLMEFRDAVLKEGIPIETAIKVLTLNPATILKLKGKGRISAGMDADLILLDKQLTIVSVFALGRRMMNQGKILVKGNYEG